MFEILSIAEFFSAMNKILTGGMSWAGPYLIVKIKNGCIINTFKVDGKKKKKLINIFASQ